VGGDDGKDAPKDPVDIVRELIRLTIKASWQKIRLKFKKVKRAFKGLFSKGVKNGSSKDRKYEPPEFIG
jgi:hypothetical protein